MFNKFLEQTNHKFVNYFDNLFNKYFKNEKNFPNSIILWGSDCIAQYFCAIEIARILNCKNNKDVNCNCISCRWIYSNEHPEIKTVSKINSKPSGDETKNISVKQVGELLNETSKKSQDYRVYIFCDADYELLNKEQIEYIEKYEELNNVILKKGDKYWVPKPLTNRVLQEESANALLKTIEETPDNLTFIFLVTSPNDLISTIVSRSQLFYVHNSFNKVYDLSFFKEIFKSFPNINKNEFLKFTNESIKYINSNEITLIDYFENMQAYFTELLSQNYSNPILKSKIISVIENIILAKKYKMSVIKDEYILDNFWVNIS